MNTGCKTTVFSEVHVTWDKVSQNPSLPLQVLFTGGTRHAADAPWTGTVWDQGALEERNGVRPHATCRHTVYWKGLRLSLLAVASTHGTEWLHVQPQSRVLLQQNNRGRDQYPLASGRMNVKLQMSYTHHSHFPRGPEQSVMWHF